MCLCAGGLGLARTMSGQCYVFIVRRIIGRHSKHSNGGDGQVSRNTIMGQMHSIEYAANIVKENKYCMR